MKKQLYRVAAATVLGLSLTTGVVAADTGNIGNIHTTGPNSFNSVRHRFRNNVNVRNDNNIDVRNTTNQSGFSGDASVRGNTKGGSAVTGSVRNENQTKAEVFVDNSSASDVGNFVPTSFNGGGFGGGGSINLTGPNSENRINSDVQNRVDVRNNNNINVTNTTNQSGFSGDATVRGNTFGGDARTGNVTNTNSSNFVIEVTN